MAFLTPSRVFFLFLRHYRSPTVHDIHSLELSIISSISASELTDGGLQLRLLI